MHASSVMARPSLFSLARAILVDRQLQRRHYGSTIWDEMLMSIWSLVTGYSEDRRLISLAKSLACAARPNLGSWTFLIAHHAYISQSFLRTKSSQGLESRSEPSHPRMSDVVDPRNDSSFLEYQSRRLEVVNEKRKRKLKRCIPLRHRLGFIPLGLAPSRDLPSL